MNPAAFASLNKVLEKLEIGVQLALANSDQEDPDRWLLGEMRAIIRKIKQELQPLPIPAAVIKEGRGKEVIVLTGSAISLGSLLILLKVLALIALVAVLGYLYANYVAPRLEARGMSAILSGLGFAAVAEQRFQEVRTRVERVIERFGHCRGNWDRFIQACNFLKNLTGHPSDAFATVDLGQQRRVLAQIERNIELLVDALESLILCMDPDDTVGLYDEIIGPSGQVRVLLNRARQALGGAYDRLLRIRRPSQLQNLRSPPRSGQ
jgi:hypothetical protein